MEREHAAVCTSASRIADVILSQVSVAHAHAHAQCTC